MGQDLYLVQSVSGETVVDFTMEEKVNLVQASLLSIKRATESTFYRCLHGYFSELIAMSKTE
jgi:hypothetical protein